MEILTDGTYYMTDIQLLIGLSSTEGERKKRERMRLQQENLLPQNVVDICPPIGKVDKCPPILELEKELDIELKIERELETGQTAHIPFGRYNNVVLSDKELSDLKAELPTKWQHYIDRLSEYMASTGKQYKNHVATIRRWAAADGKQSGMPDYSYKEGESL